MTNETEILSEADEFQALLPWYVSGKISVADKIAVESYLAKNPAARAFVEMARQEADEIFADGAEINPPRAALDKLKASIAASPAARLHAAKASLIDKLGLFLSGLAPRQLAYAGISAALALTVMAGSLVTQRTGQDYVGATGDEVSAAKGTFALVAFKPDITAKALSDFLDARKYGIVDGPKAGMFRIRLSDAVMAQDKRDAEIAKLKAQTDIVSFVSAAPEGK